MPAEITIFNPDGLGKPLGQYSQITRVRNAAEWHFIAGQLATDKAQLATDKASTAANAQTAISQDEDKISSDETAVQTAVANVAATKLKNTQSLHSAQNQVDLQKDKVTEALRFAAEPLSLSEPLREDGDAELGDIVEDRSAESPFEVAATALLPDEIEKLLAPLDHAEQRLGAAGADPHGLEPAVQDEADGRDDHVRLMDDAALSVVVHLREA